MEQVKTTNRAWRNVKKAWRFPAFIWLLLLCAGIWLVVDYAIGNGNDGNREATLIRPYEQTPKPVK